MKPATRASWPARACPGRELLMMKGRTFRWLLSFTTRPVMLVLLALACLLPAASQDSQARQALPVTQHFTEAEWQARDAEGFNDSALAG